MQGFKQPRLARGISWTMIAVGAGTLLASVVYSYSVLAFVGLGLAFWGVVLVYIQNQEPPRNVAVGNVPLPPLPATPQTVTPSQIVQELDYGGEAVYLPPKYFADSETTKIYISKQRGAKLPMLEQIQRNENRVFIKNPQSILLAPPGTELVRVLEKKLGASFNSMDLDNVQVELPRLFVEERVADSLEIRAMDRPVSMKLTPYVSLIQTVEDTVQVRIINSRYRDKYKEPEKLSKTMTTIGAEDCSAIACVLAKATGKPIIIEKIGLSEDGRIIESHYRIIEEKPQ